MIMIFACKNVFLSSRLLPMNRFLEEKLLNQKTWIFYGAWSKLPICLPENVYQFIVPFAAYLCLKYFWANEADLNVNLKKNLLFLLVMRLFVLFSFLWLLRLTNFSHIYWLPVYEPLINYYMFMNFAIFS